MSDESPPDGFVVRKSALKTLAISALMAGAASLMAWALAPTDGTEGLVRTVAIVFFGLGGLVYALIGLNHRELRVSGEGLRLVKRWDSDLVIPWSDNLVISVFELRGSQHLSVSNRRSGKGLFVSGFEITPYEILSRINAYRLAADQVLTDVERETIVPDAVAGDRNRRRRIGMGLVAAAGMAAFWSIIGIQQVGVQDLPPGVDFLWVQAPSQVQLIVGALAVGAGLCGGWFWFWPGWSRANPPIFSTFGERMLGSLGFFMLLGPIWMWWSWLQHPG